MSWIADRATADAERRVHQSHAWVLLKRRRIDDTWPHVWHAVVAALRAHVDHYNAAVSVTPPLLELTIVNPDQVQLRRDAGRAGVVRLVVDATASGITVRTPTGWSEHFEFDMSDDERIGLWIANSLADPEETGEHLLRLLFEPER
jgi:hypothetical protein